MKYRRLVIAWICSFVAASGCLAGQKKNPTIQHNQGDLTILGLRLGEKFSMPECKRKEPSPLARVPGLADPPASYVSDNSGFCFMWRHFEVPGDIKPNTPVITDKIVIAVPDDRRPDYTYGYLDAWVIDGNLERVVVFTGGFDSQDHWLAQLEEKYGTPTHVEQVEKQNGFGTVFASHIATWRFANLSVDFQGTLSSTDMGAIDIVTSKGVEFLAGPHALDHPEQQAKGPKL